VARRHPCRTPRAKRLSTASRSSGTRCPPVGWTRSSSRPSRTSCT
jgi:hypothetical protein